MKKRNFWLMRMLVVNVAFLFVITGCATKEIKITETGFLSSYNALEESADFKGMRVYKNPNVEIAEQYSEILIAPVEFRMDSINKKYEIDDDKKEEIAKSFQDRLEKGLAENYTITDAPGENVLLIRTAITGVLPNKVALNAHYITTFTKGRIGGASFESELVDSLTGERIMSFVDAKKGKKVIQRLTPPTYFKGLTKWGNTKAVLKDWADIIAEHLVELKIKYEEGM